MDRRCCVGEQERHLQPRNVSFCRGETQAILPGKMIHRAVELNSRYALLLQNSTPLSKVTVLLNGFRLVGADEIVEVGVGIQEKRKARGVGVDVIPSGLNELLDRFLEI
jgi:hypothetical protein